ncbi:MAG: CinA family protein [Alphaproteobacteria bacterium]|nr:CinA family protein [Alphaproteobacteria bacterium]
METLTRQAAVVGALLKARGETIAIAESSAGGLISAALLAVPGASAYYRAGAVIYTADARRLLLDLDDAALAGIRSCTAAFADLLARRVREKIGTTWGLGETGATGPTGNRYGDPAGTAFLAVAGPVTRAEAIATGSVMREENMWHILSRAFILLEAALRAAPPQAK